MTHISALSDDILDVILNHLIKTEIPSIPPSTEPEREEWNQTIVTNMRKVASLRFVCRQWAKWLYERHLYHMLWFHNSAQSDAFISQLDERPNPVLPRCCYLKVSELWTWGPLPRLYTDMKTEFRNLDALLDRFSETICALDIEVVNFFTLPIATIERIRDIPNLQSLKLGINFTKGTKLRGVAVDRAQLPRGLPLDSECLSSLLRATHPRVVFVDFTDFRPVCSPMTLGSSLGDHHLSGITTLKLDVKVEGNLNQNGIVSLAARLPNLKTLSIGGAGYDGQLLRPLFECLREQLEELIINDVRIIEPIVTWNFPKLRLFRLHDWDRNFRDFLKNNMFSSAALRVLSFNSFPFHKKRPAFLEIPWEKLHIQQLEFHFTSHFPPPRQYYEEACRDRRVECVCTYHGDINLREDDRLNSDLSSAFQTGLRF
ncbi:hypothetical protein PtA15_11A347 [Puccinia triticina]|uniref:F-box domain-containing protein n=1 Tax=Puccinia triticina TaxID=208348 RepID=A0ABY7D098_9BASI|nr:uncharacterized protein PtA15_11A347 [Puccinia triticina]WAQ89657.1 hypothetical protein PtA15_11A347 [Puccinia triticina]